MDVKEELKFLGKFTNFFFFFLGGGGVGGVGRGGVGLLGGVRVNVDDELKFL